MMRDGMKGLWALAALAAWAPGAFAGMITIDADHYAAGEVITDSSGHANFSRLSLDDFGNLETGAVYSQELDPSSCSPSPGMPTCTATGTKVFGHSATASSTYANLWGEVEDATKYLLGDTWDAPYFRNVLRIDFTSPTNYVDVLGGFWDGDSVGISAFNSLGQVVASCIRPGVPGAEPGDCRQRHTDELIGPSGIWGWYRTSLQSSAWDISYVLIGGAANYRQLDEINFATIPSPQGTAAMMIAGLCLMAGALRGRRLGLLLR